MCSPDLRYKVTAIVADVLTFNARRQDSANKIAIAGADFDLVLSNIKHGGVYRLIVTKSIAGDVIMTPDAGDMVFGEGLGAAITLSGADETKYLFEITNDGTHNCIRPLGSSVDLTGYATEAYVTGAIANKLNTTVTVEDKATVAGSYTLTAADNGKLLRFTDVGAVSVVLPNSMTVGYNVGVIQDGAGQITFGAEVGGTLQNRSTHTKTAGLYAITALVVVANAGGSAAKYNLSGDTAA